MLSLKSHKTHDDQNKKLSLMDVFSSFLVLGSGLLVSAFVLVGELVCFRRNLVSGCSRKRRKRNVKKGEKRKVNIGKKRKVSIGKKRKGMVWIYSKYGIMFENFL